MLPPLYNQLIGRIEKLMFSAQSSFADALSATFIRSSPCMLHFDRFRFVSSSLHVIAHEGRV
jgi:hypothetical protein